MAARRNGCAMPLHPLQVASWVLFSLFVSFFGAIYLPYFGSELYVWIPLAVPYAIAVLLVAITSFRSTTCDPGDPNLRTAEGEPPGDTHVYCYYCQRYVFSESRHCRTCDKCIDVYDHHCLWLNNCVGKANYRPFFILLSSATFMLLEQLGVGIHIICKYGLNRAAFARRVHDIYPDLDTDAYFGMVVGVTGVITFTLASLGQLLLFHINLNRLGLTTYEFIVEKQRRTMEHQEAKRAAGDNSTTPQFVSHSNAVSDGKGGAGMDMGDEESPGAEAVAGSDAAAAMETTDTPQTLQQHQPNDSDDKAPNPVPAVEVDVASSQQPQESEPAVAV